MFPLSEGCPELFPESMPACCSPRVLKGRNRVYSDILCVSFSLKQLLQGVLRCFQIFAAPHTEVQIPQAPFTPHKQHGLLNSVLSCICNTNLALKILISYVFNTTWGKVAQMCFSQPRCNAQDVLGSSHSLQKLTSDWLPSAAELTGLRFLFSQQEAQTAPESEWELGQQSASFSWQTLSNKEKMEAQTQSS